MRYQGALIHGIGASMIFIFTYLVSLNFIFAQNQSPQTVQTPTIQEQELADQESAKVRRGGRKIIEQKNTIEENKVDTQDSFSDFKEENKKIEEAKKEEKSDEADSALGKNADDEKKSSREYLTLAVEAAPISMWVPLKYGGFITWYFIKDLGLEFSYLYSKLDSDTFNLDSFGEISEKKIDLVGRFKMTKSFSIFAGYSMQETEIRLSDETIRGNPLLPFKNTDVEVQGVIAGISNHWSFSRLTLSIDWISLFLPLTSSAGNDLRKQFQAFSDTQDYKDVEDGYDSLEDLPRISIFELGLGFTF